MSRQVTVAILNWNGEKLLPRFLPDVIANSPEAEIVVIDNGSTDGSVDLLGSNFPSVGLLCLDKNYGFAEGYNRALDTIATPLTVLLNSDVSPAPGWLTPLVAAMADNPDVAACQPKVLQVDSPTMFEYAGACGGFLDRNGYPYCRGRIFSTVETDRGQYDDTVEVDWTSGAAMMLRTDLFKEAGGLDSHFFAHMEEIDLCWRFRLMGYRLLAVPGSVVYHLGGGSLAMGSPRKTYLNFRNNLLMLYKNLPAEIRGKALIRRRLLDTLAWGVNVVTLRWRHAAAILRAHRDYRRMVNLIYRPQSGNDQPGCPDLLSGRPNLLVDYYLRRLKTFSRL